MWGCSCQINLPLGLFKNRAHGRQSTAKDIHEHENELTPTNNQEKPKFSSLSISVGEGAEVRVILGAGGQVVSTATWEPFDSIQ